MEQAISEVGLGNISQNHVTKSFSAPVPTLCRRINSKQEPALATKKKLGRFESLFSADMEACSKNYLGTEKRFFSLTNIEVRSLGSQYAENTISHTISITKKDIGSRVL